MALPKKKSRAIVVEGHNYRWMVKVLNPWAVWEDGKTLTVDNEDTGELHQQKFFNKEAITPEDVKQFILNKFAEHK